MNSIIDSPDPFGDGSLVAKYQLDGDATDTTGRFNGASAYVSYAAGKFDQCGVFNLAYINTGVIIDSTISMSLSAYFKASRTGVSQFLIGDGNGENARTRAFIAISSSNKFYVGMGDGSASWYDDSTVDATPYLDGEFHHVVLVVSGATQALYVDNVLLHEYTSTVSAGEQGEFPYHIGRLGTYKGGLYWGGMIDQVEIYNKALTLIEVTALYNQYMTPIVPITLNLLRAFELITWSNKETKAQANPYPPVMQNVKPVEPVPTLLGKSGDYQTLLNQKGEQRPVGYYQSTVMINKVPTAGKRVFCFTNNGQLRDETVSDKYGIYRFDHLDMNEKYMFVAQESNDRLTPPEYNAVASDWQTPTKYGE